MRERNATRWNDMKVIVNDKDKCLKKFAMNESAENDIEVVSMGQVGGKYDFIMMVGDGTVYGFEGREIYFSPVGDRKNPIGFQWEPVKGKDVDFMWLPIDGEYDDGEEDWVPFEDMDIYDDEVGYDD